MADNDKHLAPPPHYWRSLARDRASGRELADFWAHWVAPAAARGTVLLDVRHGSTGADGIEMMVEARGNVFTSDPLRLRAALGVEDPACLTVETDGLSRALVTVYDRPPLEHTPHADGEALVMDADGRITVGVHHDGHPARIRPYVPGSGARNSVSVGAMRSGLSTALRLRLAGEQHSGIVSWVADLRSGQSPLGTKEHFDWPASTTSGAILMLQSALAVVEERAHRRAAIGAGPFFVDAPDPLIQVHLIGADRLLAYDAPYRNAAARLVTRIARIGPDVGVGINLAVKTGHIGDFGGPSTLRTVLENGEMVLLRWVGNRPPGIVDDVLPDGARLTAIPVRGGRPRLHSRFYIDDLPDDSYSTTGTGYILGDRPTSVMRHLRPRTPEPHSGADPLLDLYGTGEPSRLEQTSHQAAGNAYEARHESGIPRHLLVELADLDG
ncbi:hypothetical protein [Embleya sp. NBC_00896]|uniref:hypothetical protein n=1 Tax=Embleya sp. NBC_00896 TaxID=2975961 RepID=UPI002F9190F7|nr:hypothetical protein OG928_48160 [Embleya sp. NBC_00896]